MGYEILADKIEWEWGDGSLVTLDWFQEAGCFCADRWLYDDDVEGEVELADDCVIGPYDFWFLESLESLEEALGRPLPSDVRAALTRWSDADPFTEEDRENWGGMVAFGITRKTPEGDWMETFAPPGDPNPFARRWIPEATLWAMGLL